ncbi:MAG: phage holin family protein [Cyanobacteria bacterium RM1_2_2]|nr:phage holin family protein [Cyanobacteria bacterium RM1_2_2]
MVAFLITAVVTAISLLIISYIPFLGVEVDSPGKALLSGIVFGLLNAFLKPILTFLGAPINFLTLGLFGLLVNVLIFGLTAKIIEGFRLRNGFVSAILGAIVLSIVNSILFSLLTNLGLVVPA